MYSSATASIWFEIWGSWLRVKKISIFFRQFHNKYRFFQAKIACLQLLILFLFKSHHFRKYFLYMTRYNNISRPPCPKSGGSRPPTPRIDAPAHRRQIIIWEESHFSCNSRSARITSIYCCTLNVRFRWKLCSNFTHIAARL